MTLTTTHNRIEYVGNGSTTVFPYDFLIPATTDLLIYHDDVQQTLGFSISGAGEAGGGNVTYTTAPATGVAIVFIRATDQTQQVNLIEGDKLPAEVVEEMFDKMYAVAQDLAERMDRTVRIPPTSEAADETVFLPDPADPANQDKAIFINSDGQLEMRAILASDIASPISVEGDLIRGSTGGTPERLGIGTVGQLLTVVAGQAAWATPSASGIQETLFDAVGDLLVGVGPDTVDVLPVGADRTLLSADNTQPEGIRWRDRSELPADSQWTFAELADPAPPASTEVQVYVPSGVSGLKRLRGQNIAQKVDYLAIPTHLRFAGNPYKEVVSTVTQTSIFATPPTIYAGTLGIDRALRLTILGDVLNNTGAGSGFTLRLKYGATTFAALECLGNLGTTGTRRGWRATGTLVARGGTTVQIGSAELVVGVQGVSGVGVSIISPTSLAGFALHNTVAENSGTDLALDITIQPQVNSANLSVRVFTVLVEWW